MVVCTALIAVTDTKKGDSAAAIGVKVPGGKQVKDASTCTDQAGKLRGEAKQAERGGQAERGEIVKF